MSEETRISAEPVPKEEPCVYVDQLAREGQTEQRLLRPTWTWRRSPWLILSLLGIIGLQQCFLLKMSTELSEQRKISERLGRLLSRSEVEILKLMDKADKVRQALREQVK
jgi:hypothetical protein